MDKGLRNNNGLVKSPDRTSLWIWRFMFLVTALPLLLMTPGCGSEPCEIVLGPSLVVVSVAPTHGAVYVDVNTEVIVAFSDRLEEQSAQTALSLMDGDVVVNTSMELGGNDKVITLRPTAPLEPATNYYITVANYLTGVDTGQLGVDLKYRFKTR